MPAGHPDEALQESVAVYNRNRQLVEEVYRLRRERPGLLSGREGTACAVAGMWMRKEEHNRLLEELLEGLGEAGPEEAGYAGRRGGRPSSSAAASAPPPTSSTWRWSSTPIS